MRLTLTALALLGMATAASADFVDGLKLHRACEVNRALVGGYSMAISDMVQDKEVIEITGMPVCLSEEVEASQLIDVTCAYLRDNPEDRHKQAKFLLIEAYAEAFPCNP